MLIQPIAELFKAQSVLEELHPRAKRQPLFAGAHELAVMENVLHNRQRTLLTGRCAGARRETVTADMTADEC